MSKMIKDNVLSDMMSDLNSLEYRKNNWNNYSDIDIEIVKTPETFDYNTSRSIEYLQFMWGKSNGLAFIFDKKYNVCLFFDLAFDVNEQITSHEYADIIADLIRSKGTKIGKSNMSKVCGVLKKLLGSTYLEYKEYFTEGIQSGLFGDSVKDAEWEHEFTDDEVHIICHLLDRSHLIDAFDYLELNNEDYFYDFYDDRKMSLKEGLEAMVDGLSGAYSLEHYGLDEDDANKFINLLKRYNVGTERDYEFFMSDYEDKFVKDAVEDLSDFETELVWSLLTTMNLDDVVNTYSDFSGFYDNDGNKIPTTEVLNLIVYNEPSLWNEGLSEDEANMFIELLKRYNIGTEEDYEYMLSDY